VIGGVCAGLPELWGLGTAGLRIAFVLAGLCGGVGVIIYLACWLVLPGPGDDPNAERVRDVVVLAWGMGGVVAALLAAGIAAVVTVFGLGWVVFGLALVVLLVTLSGRLRIPQFAGLAAVVVLTLPAVAVGLSSLRLPVGSDGPVVQPATVAGVRGPVYRSNFGTLLIDLRHTRFPTAGIVPLRIHAGLRRTIVALPAGSCVHVRIDYQVHTYAGQLATLVAGDGGPPFPDVVLFGRLYGATSADPHGTAVSRAILPGPMLRIAFSSQGGGLFVRDYPDNVNPDLNPSWPGFRPMPEPRPVTRGEPKKLRARMLRAWRRRRAAQIATAEQIDTALPGPCAL
jgi:phage shock protein PspC (stress-responsive transcriptional regulator)